MQEEATCGAGLAEHAALPAKLGELLAALAEILERHMTALDAEDPNGRRELEAYGRLATQHREIAARLRGVASEMSGYRALPVSPHDEAAMSDPKAQAAFVRYVRVERNLIAFLQDRVQRDQALLNG
jgi:hypothetical protein